jgi:hypothetical protein
MLAWAPGTGAVGTGPHPLSIEIDGVDFVRDASSPAGLPTILQDGLNIEQPGPGSNGTASFVIWDPNSTAVVSEWSEVTIDEHAAAIPRQFGGFVHHVQTEIRAGSSGRWLYVDCVGYGKLLDWKVVPTNVADTGQFDVGQFLLSLVGNHGGKIQAAGFVVNEINFNDDDDAHVALIFPNIPTVPDVAWLQADYSTITETTLRSALEQRMTTGTDGRLGGTLGDTVRFVYWVDGYARLHATWDVTDADSAFTGEAPDIDESNVTALSVDNIGVDQATSVYVDGGNANGSGYYRTPGKERAGDLEALVSQESSTSEALRDLYGAAAIQPNAMSGEATRVSDVPLDYRIGDKVSVTSSRLGLTGSEPLRIIGIRIRYDAVNWRTYELTFGGRLRPSLTATLGRFVRAN